MYLVLIDDGTKKGKDNIGDFVSVHKDSVVLGPAYASFKVVQIPGEPEDFKRIANSFAPEIKRIYKATTTEWTIEPPEAKTVWNDNGEWKELSDIPERALNISFSEQDLQRLSDKGESESNKQQILSNRIKFNFVSSPLNHEVVSIEALKGLEVSKKSNG